MTPTSRKRTKTNRSLSSPIILKMRTQDSPEGNSKNNLNKNRKFSGPHRRAKIRRPARTSGRGTYSLWRAETKTNSSSIKIKKRSPRLYGLLRSKIILEGNNLRSRTFRRDSNKFGRITLRKTIFTSTRRGRLLRSKSCLGLPMTRELTFSILLPRRKEILGQTNSLKRSGSIMGVINSNSRDLKLVLGHLRR